MPLCRFKVQGVVWLYPGDSSAWHFVTLPRSASEEIRELTRSVKRGWGSVPVRATLGKTTWETSMFPDRKANAYLLPLKAQVRKRERITAGDTVLMYLDIGERLENSVNLA